MECGRGGWRLGGFALVKTRRHRANGDGVSAATGAGGGGQKSWDLANSGVPGNAFWRV